jgi:hypothetical protein
MEKSEQYRRFAEECVRMASATTEERTRAIFMQMAQTWFRLAEEKQASRGDDVLKPPTSC